MTEQEKRLILELIGAGVSTHRALGCAGIGLLELSDTISDQRVKTSVKVNADQLLSSNRDLMEKLQAAMTLFSKNEQTPND